MIKIEFYVQHITNMQNYSTIIISDCFQTMNPFCLIALSITCKDYKQSLVVAKTKLIKYISNNKCESNEIINWIYKLFGNPSYEIMLAINESLRGKITEYYTALCYTYSNRYTDKILHLAHISNIESLNYHTIVTISTVISFKISYRIMENFEKDVGFYTYWLHGSRVVSKLKSIIDECPI